MQAVRESKIIREHHDPDQSQVGGSYQEDNRPNYQNLIQAQVDRSQRMAKNSLSTSGHSVIQRKRKRKADDEDTTQDKGVSVQRIVREDDIGKKIIIDDPRASDFGDTGKLIRKSRNVHGCLVVEFDNEPGVQYRVWPHEMSALGELNQEAQVGVKKYVQIALHGPSGIIIMADVVWKRGEQEANFKAYYRGKLAGKLEVATYGSDKLFLLDIHTYKVVPGVHGLSRVKGLGAVLLHLSSTMARKFQVDEITLGATKKEQRHPGTFYELFGFKSREDLTAWGNSLANFLSANGDKTINMDATPDSISTETGPYISGENWQFGAWKNL